MGAQQSILYSVEVPGQKQKQNETKVRRRPEFVDGLVDSPDQQFKTLQLILRKSFQKFSNNECLGTIITTKQGSETQKPVRQIKYKTYGQVHKITQILSKAIVDLNLAPQLQQVKGLKLRFLGLFSKNRTQWLQVDAMTILQGYCLIPIYDTLGAENIPYVLNHTNLSTLFCSKESLNTLLKCSDLGQVKNIISFDNVEEDILLKFKQKGVTIYLYGDLLKKYQNSEIKTESRTLGPNEVVSFCYTSGTTGPPKGAMLTGRNYAAYAGVLKNMPILSLHENDVHLSYLPLAHILQNICVLAMFVYGGKIVTFSGDVRNIKNDIQLVKPTFFMSVPRLYNRFYEGIKTIFDKTQGWKKMLLDRALSIKLHNVQTNGGYTHRLYDNLVFKKTKQVFGGRCRFMASGSAPLSPEVHSFMKVIACAPLMEGYGQTQSTGGSFITDPRDFVVGHVGGPTSMAEYKLLDIPEMNYTHNDKDDQGRPMPRGQILIGGPGVFIGYYKDQQKTKETIDEDGFLHTGDVGAIMPVTGALKIIDRKKNIFKLQQGEYVASERVQAVYMKREDAIQEIYLYGDSSQNFCVVIITPVAAFVENIAKQKNIQGSYEQLCKNKEVRTEYLNEINKFSKKQGLHGFQQPKNVYLETGNFQEKGVLTTTMKLQRFAAKNTYKSQIDAMYKQGMLKSQ